MLISQAFKPELLRLLNELPEEAWTHNLWRQTLYKELEAGRCTEDEVSAFEREGVAAVRCAVRGVFDGIPSRFGDTHMKRRGRRSSPENRIRSTRSSASATSAGTHSTHSSANSCRRAHARRSCI